MRKVPRSAMSSLPGILHKAFVLTCIGVTIGATAYSGGLIYHHYTVVLPERERIEEAALAAKSSVARSEFDLDEGSSSSSVLKA